MFHVYFDFVIIAVPKVRLNYDNVVISTDLLLSPLNYL